MWCGARSFESRRVSLVGLAVGPALWIVAFEFDGFAQSLQARISLVAAISASYALLAARELWYARDRDLISRWPTLVLVIGHTGFLLARIPYAQDLAASVSSGHAHGAVATVMAFEALFVAFCLPFLRVAMSKERAELEQRLAAETDPLSRPSGGRSRSSGLLRSRRYVGPPRRSVRPAGRRGIRLSDGECVGNAGFADRGAAAAPIRRHFSLPTSRSRRRSASASPWRAKRAATCRRC